MKQNLRRNWWILIGLWIIAATAAVVYPLAKQRDLGTIFEILSLSFLASPFGFATLFMTIAYWRTLPILERCLGLLPTLYLVAPFAIFGR